MDHFLPIEREVTVLCDLPAGMILTSVVVIALPPIPQSLRLTSSTMTKVTWRKFSPSMETIVSVTIDGWSLVNTDTHEVMGILLTLGCELGGTASISFCWAGKWLSPEIR